MGMVPPMLPSFLRKRQPPQTKEEHPMQEIWDQVDESESGGQNNQALMRLMESIEERIVPPSGPGSAVPISHVDPKLIGEESR